MASIIRANGTIEPFPLIGGQATLQALQRAVDGWIQVILLPDDKLLIVNEEGLYREDLSTNHLASTMAIGHAVMDRRGIVGDAVLLDRKEML